MRAFEPFRHIRRMPLHDRKAIYDAGSQISAMFILGWGVWVLAWGADRALSSQAFAVLYEQASLVGPPYRVVGWSGIAIGLLYSLAVSINGRGWWWTPIIRGIVNAFAVLFFTNLAMNLGGGQLSSPGTFTYLAIAIVVYFGLFCANLNRLAQSILMSASKLKAWWRVRFWT